MLHLKTKRITFLLMVNMFIIFLLSLSVCHAQNQALVDSLLLELKIHTDDTIRVGVLNDLAWEFRMAEPKTAEAYAEEALSLSEHLSNERGKLTAMNRLGQIAILNGEFDKAETIYLEVLKRELELGFEYGIGRAQTQLSEIASNKGDFTRALNYSLQSHETFRNINNLGLVAVVSNKIGYLYTQLGNYDKAMTYLLASLEKLKELNDENGIASTSCNFGVLFNHLKDYSKAKEYLTISRQTYEKYGNERELAKVYNNLGVSEMGSGNFDEALEHLENALQLKDKLGVLDYDASAYNNLGNLYHLKNDMDKAFAYYLKGESIQIDSTRQDQIEVKINMADIYYRRNNINTAIDYYLTALDITERFGQSLTRLKILNDLALCYSKLEVYDLAIKYKNLHGTLNDSLDRSYRGAIQLKAKYEEEQKKNDLLQKDKEIATADLGRSKAINKYNDILIYSLGIGIVLVVLLFFAILRGNKQRERAKLAEKNRLIASQNAQKLMDKQELRFNQARLDGQEKERTRIAEDLHDRLGGMLSMVKVHYNFVEDHIELLQKSNKKQYEKANALLDDACEEVRKIANDMNSGILAKFGLVAALEDLSYSLNESGHLVVEFNAHGINNLLGADDEVAIFRIIQELMNNILKHAKAKEVTIQLIQGEHIINIMVEDDGIGFDSEEKRTKGMGLVNVASRVEKLQGELRIDSHPGNGTTISIDIPIKEI